MVAVPRRFRPIPCAAAAFLALAVPASLAPAASPPPFEGPAAGVPADPAAMDGVRDLLRAGERGKALEAARAVVAAAGEDVEAHMLYQDAARGQVPRPLLIREYETRAAKTPGGAAVFLLSRLLAPPEAEKAIRDGLKADAKSYWLQVGLSSTLARLGRASQAQAAAEAALALRPGDPRAAIRAAGQVAEARRFPGAEALYRKALEGAPDDGESLRGLAHALLRQGKADEAAATLARIPSARKPDPSRLLLDAALLMERGDEAGAEKALVQATTLSPGDVDAQVQLSLLRLRRIEAAARAAGETVKKPAVAGEVATLQKSAVALPERGDIRYAMGYAHEITGDVDGAIEDYREATRLDPLDGDSITALGALLVGKGLLDDAAREFLRALDREPEDGLVLQNLAYVYDQQGKTKEALETYQKLVKLEPKNARAWHGLGLATDAAGKGKESAVPLQKAVDLSPETGRFRRDLGEALMLNRRVSQAEAEFAKAVELDPKDDAAWDALGRCRREQKKYAEAVAAYEHVIELRPKDDSVHLMVGALCQEYLKDYDKALAHYQRYLALGGEAGDVEDWIAECQAEIEKKK